MGVGESWPLIWVERIDGAMLTLRVYEDGPCPLVAGDSYHNAEAYVGSAPVEWSTRDDDVEILAAIDPDRYAGDERWPTVCGCGRPFTDDARRQVNQDILYVHPDLGVQTASTLPPGSMYDVWWAHWRHPDDGISLGITIPRSSGYPWMVEYPCMSRDQPCQHGRRGSCCWVRHGDPRTGHVQVSPSILTPDFHGIVQNDRLVWV